jgi:hypothetical protein
MMENGGWSCLLSTTVLISVDVASYEMEVQENTADNNVVTMLLKHGVDGHTFTSASAAKIYVRKRIEQCEVKLQGAISSAFADSVLGESNTIRRWLCALPYVLSGKTWFCQQVSNHRYQRRHSLLLSSDAPIQLSGNACST